jgi:hypothetical protein
LIVVGGSYIETCARPAWQRVFGSGGRAAAALGSISPGTELHTYAARSLSDDVRSSMAAFRVVTQVIETDEEVTFSYFHPLSPAHMSPRNPAMQPPLKAAGAAVLRFGMVEGEGVVEGGRVTYDPQGASAYVPFHANGSRADELSIVLNEGEVGQATGLEGAEAGRALLREGAAVVVIKGGAKGALVLAVDGSETAVPAYRSERVFKIGSGDVFSAIFAHTWAELKLEPAAAAAAASAETARYVATRSLPIEELRPPDNHLALPAWRKPGKIYLAGPFFDTAQLWMVEELRAILLEMGATVFSPYHDVGMGLPSADIAVADLEGLRASDAVLAVIDGGDTGTVFEVGYAAALGKPVVALAERISAGDLTMFAVPGVDIVEDLATAVYKAVWSAML